jgi:hypothetical protein
LNRLVWTRWVRDGVSAEKQWQFQNSNHFQDFHASLVSINYGSGLIRQLNLWQSVILGLAQLDKSVALPLLRKELGGKIVSVQLSPQSLP